MLSMTFQSNVMPFHIFLKLMPSVSLPLFFLQDDANNDPQWSEEQLLAAGFELAGLTIGGCEVDIMSKSTVAIFEVLEKAWATQDCTLVDMKVRNLSVLG